MKLQNDGKSTKLDTRPFSNVQQNTNEVQKCVWTQSIIFILSSIKWGRRYQSGFWMSSLHKFSHRRSSSAWRSTLLVCFCGNLCPLREALQRRLCSWFTAYLTPLGLWAPLFPQLWGICVYMCAYVLENEKKKKKGWCGDGFHRRIPRPLRQGSERCIRLCLFHKHSASAVSLGEISYALHLPP